MNTIKFLKEREVRANINNYLGGFSPLELKIIEKYSIPPILHLFSGNSTIGLTVDINPNSKAKIKMDVFEYIKNCAKEFNTILMDPIYSSEERKEIWRQKYSKLGIKGDALYIFPYDTRRTKELWDFFMRKYPKRIIIKSLSHYTIPGYDLLIGFNIYIGAFKPNRCISIFQAKNQKLNQVILSENGNNERITMISSKDQQEERQN